MIPRHKDLCAWAGGHHVRHRHVSCGEDVLPRYAGRLQPPGIFL